MMIRKTLITLTAALSAAWAFAFDTHTVVRGDTLYGIANRYQVSVEALRQQNNLGSSAIQPGQELRIPGTSAAGATARASVYTVRSGDSLSTIASRHGVTVAALRGHNGLRSNTIQPGQKLRIPGSASQADEGASTVYTVRRGDSLARIASRHGTTVDALRHHNALRSNTIQPGQNLVIPGRQSATSASRVAAAVDQAAERSHTVRRGESLWTIATRHGVSVSQLAGLNGLSDRHTLQPGQTLRIPTAGSRRTSTSAIASAEAARKLALESNNAIIVDAATGTVLYEKNADETRSIASITKVMTAMVVLDAGLPLDEVLSVDRQDIDRLKNTTSRMPIGAKLTRREMLHLALMSSENRAASALARHYPGGAEAFIAAMNRKAKDLAMTSTHFADSTGLDPRNVSTASDLAKMVSAASSYPLIAQLSTAQAHQVTVNPAGTLQYRNSNPLVQQGRWNIALSKTGYINEAGRCLVMQADVGSRPAVMVFLKSGSRHSPVADATRVKNWLESGASGINLASL